MARKSGARRRGKRAPGPRRRRDQGPIRIPRPETRLTHLFKLLDDVSATADRALSAVEATTDHLILFDLSIFVRGVNALKSVRLLAAEGHWENASPIVRQLFELVVNMEYLGAQSDREKATFSYAKFGLLQMVQQQVLEAEYDRKTGRAVDAQRVAQLQSLLKNTFPEFRLKDRNDGSLRFATSWSRKTTSELARASGNRMREDHYRLLFTPWSEQTHAAPVALLAGMFPNSSQGWIEEAVADDDVRIAETVSMGTMLFLELWRLLPSAPSLDPQTALTWMSGLTEEAIRHRSPDSSEGL